MIAYASLLLGAYYTDAHKAPTEDEESVPFMGLLITMAFDLLMAWLIFVAPTGFGL